MYNSKQYNTNNVIIFIYYYEYDKLIVLLLLYYKNMHPEKHEILEIDNLDRQILAILMDDALVPYTEIAKKLIVSAGTIHVRMKKLEDAGIVKRSVLMVDHTKLGYDLTAFLGVYLFKGSVYKQVINQLESIPEVIEAYYTTGQYSIFLKIVCKNTNHLREVLNEKIQAIDGIERTETLISLEESIKRSIKV
jgi:Lrp/AsnC family transcriptional regulator for asnA, asnC and gidA